MKKEDENTEKEIENEEDFIVGKWKSTEMELNGEKIQLEESTDDSYIVILEINKSGQATLTYKGSTVIGNMNRSGDKYRVDTDGNAMIEVTVDEDTLLVNIIKEPLAEPEEETLYWVCERTQ